MISRKLSILAFALGMSVPLISAAFAETGDVPRADTAIFDMDHAVNDPGNFNMLRADTTRDHGAHQALFEPLFILNLEAGQIEPWLAVTWTFNDELNDWTIELRQDIAWSDGERFDADDVVFTVKTILENDALDAPEAVALRDQVESVEKISDFKIRFKLRSTNPRFVLDIFTVRVFSSLLIMPEHIWRGQDPVSFRFENPVGTGPYTLTSVSESGAVYDRNEKWWGNKPDFHDLPEPLRLVWRQSTNEAERVSRIADDELDASTAISLDALKPLQASRSGILTWDDTPPLTWTDPCNRQLEFNTVVEPWSDPALRRAVSLLVDRSAIVSDAFGGTTSPARSMFPDYGALEPITLALKDAGLLLPDTADVDAGKNAIEALGWLPGSDGIYEKNGNRLSLPIHVNAAEEDDVKIAKVVAAQLKSAGVDTQIIAIDDDTRMRDIVSEGQFTAAITTLSCGSVTEPWASLSRYATLDVPAIGNAAPGDNNVGRWSGENQSLYRGLVETIATLPLGAPEIPELTVSAYQKLNADMPFIPLVQSAKIIPFSETYWVGWPTINNNFNHPAHWWGSGHQIIHNLQRNDF